MVKRNIADTYAKVPKDGFAGMISGKSKGYKVPKEGFAGMISKKGKGFSGKYSTKGGF